MKGLIFLLVVFCSTASLGLDVPGCGTSFTEWGQLLNAVYGNATFRKTSVRLCHEDSGLKVEFQVWDEQNPISHAVECNVAPYPYQVRIGMLCFSLRGSNL